MKKFLTVSLFVLIFVLAFSFTATAAFKDLGDDFVGEKEFTIVSFQTLSGLLTNDEKLTEFEDDLFWIASQKDKFNTKYVSFMGTIATAPNDSYQSVVQKGGGTIAQLVELTRNSEYLTLGASPRASIAAAHAAQATAYLSGRDYVTPDDVKKIFKAVTAHRVMISTRTRAEGHDAQWVIGRIMSSVKVPVI